MTYVRYIPVKAVGQVTVKVSERLLLRFTKGEIARKKNRQALKQSTLDSFLV